MGGMKTPHGACVERWQRLRAPFTDAHLREREGVVYDTTVQCES